MKQYHMREWFLRVGTGNPPDGYEHFTPVQSLEEYVGVKGHINLHLHGAWWTIVSPGLLMDVMNNWNQSRRSPTVTISL